LLKIKWEKVQLADMIKLISGTKKHFYTKFQKVSSGCWEWIAGLNNKGYGLYYINQEKIYAHRYSYIIHKGVIPEKMCVLHKCDNTICINPSHLWLGTQSENMKDAAKKGRMDKIKKNKGEDVKNSVLTNEKVKEIKIKLKNGEIGVKLAKEYGVTKTTIYQIKHGKWWKHI
jgi:hypothetical protein